MLGGGGLCMYLALGEGKRWKGGFYMEGKIDTAEARRS